MQNITLDNNTHYGANNAILHCHECTIFGRYNIVVGNRNIIEGSSNTLYGDDNLMKGNQNESYGKANKGTGINNRIHDQQATCPFCHAESARISQPRRIESINDNNNSHCRHGGSDECRTTSIVATDSNK